MVGRSSSASGSEVFLWDSTNGMRTVVSELAAKGVNLPAGWTLIDVSGISADGTRIVGYGINPSGQQEAWLAVVPEPGTGVLVLTGLLGIAGQRRRSALV